MINITVSEKVWDTLVSRGMVGESVNDVLMRKLGIQEELADRLLEEIINDDPAFFKEIILIRNDVLHVSHGNANGSWILKPLRKVDIHTIIDEAVDTLFCASINGRVDGIREMAFPPPTTANRVALGNFIHGVLVEYYFKHQYLESIS